MIGCASDSRGVKVRPAEPWEWSAGTGQSFATPHYLIRTTVTDRETIDRFANTMEDALRQYRTLVPGMPLNDRPLVMYLFARHDEWATYIADTAGPDAATLLKVYAGGYTIRDRFVCWLTTEPDTLSRATHEGFHQFIARHFTGRLPPTVEEGLATLFETLKAGPHGSVVDPDHNPRRLAALKASAETNSLIPFKTLLRLHAGDLVEQSVALREGYYAQSWALARFLRDDPRYAAPFRDLLRRTALGTPPVNVGDNAVSATYYPSRIEPWLSNGLQRPIDTIEQDYTAFVQHLVRRYAAD
jgi:hypothetical protein